MSTVELRNAVALVTGATSGIGRDIALGLTREGTIVFGSGRNQSSLHDLEEAVRGWGGRFHGVRLDVTDDAGARRVVGEILARHGKIDVLVCSAGVYVRKPVAGTALADYEESMAVNFYGSVRLILGLLPSMLSRKSGHIVVVGSVDGKKGLPPDGPYVSSKFAITGFMDVLRQELRGTGVYATTILPGRVDTPMIAQLDVPWISAKVSSRYVARATLRALRRRKAEVIVPWPGPKLLVVANAFSPRLGDWLVRVFRLRGEERTK